MIHFSKRIKKKQQQDLEATRSKARWIGGEEDLMRVGKNVRV
jgi:hypothetical protein